LATHKSAIKRDGQSKIRRARNVAYKSRAKTAIKEVRLAIADNNSDRAMASLNNAISILHKIQSKGVIHKNNAGRKISRLAREVNKLAMLRDEEHKAIQPDSQGQDPPSNQS
jgi:small subunit ribosomal protein S20